MRIILTTLHSKFIHSCLALPCLASYCRDIPNCEFVIQEYTVHEPKETILAAILASEPNVVAFSVYIWNRRPVLELADALAVVKPGMVIILGGPEVSFEGPEFFKNHPRISAIVRGEGEASFREVLLNFAGGKESAGTPGTLWNKYPDAIEGKARAPLEELDSIPSPFESGLVDLSRGYVYFETSRGCPYRCLFCMSALEDKVRSFSMERIRRDLDFLISRKVPRIKLVDRTFNYDPERAREIFSHILENNRESHFHFEVGANVLDEETIQLLRRVPENTFQFEIGIQSCSPDTLRAVHRHVSLEKIIENVSRLRAETNVHLHLDLVAGLPRENYVDFLASIDRTSGMQPHHLQIELVKLLPGSMLRRGAHQEGIDFDPHPPYTVLRTRDLSFADLSRLRRISRVVDMTYNSGHFQAFLEGLARRLGSLAYAFERIADFWDKRKLFRAPMQRRDIFENMWLFILENFAGEEASLLTEFLARDCARSERVVLGNAPRFFNTNLSAMEIAAVRDRVREETLKVKGQGIKIQYFAAIFRWLPELDRPVVLLFFYRTKRGRKIEVKEILLQAAS